MAQPSLGIQSGNSSILQLSEVDVCDEIEYWSLSVIACVMGLRPHVKAFMGFCQRIWGSQNIDKVVPLKRGQFLIRFLNQETKEKALGAMHLFFDKHPVLLKQWEDGVELQENEFDYVPIWIHMPELPLKSWGKTCLEKIVGLVGTPVKPDTATSLRERVAYVRYLVEMKLDGDFPSTVSFINEKGILMEQVVTYEWRPVQCKACSKWGHVEKECKSQKVWKPKVSQPVMVSKEPVEAASGPVTVAPVQVPVASVQVPVVAAPVTAVASVPAVTVSVGPRNQANTAESVQEEQGWQTVISRSRLKQLGKSVVSTRTSYAGMTPANPVEGVAVALDPSKGEGGSKENG